MTDQIKHIKDLMHQVQNNGKCNIDIETPDLGESTLITVKGKDFKAENVIITREEIFVEGYYDKDTSKKSIRLEQIDEYSLPELAYSLECATENK